MTARQPPTTPAIESGLVGTEVHTMPQRTPDHADHTRDHDDGGDATVLPFRATRSATQDTWNVERIDTEPMTAQQYDSAVATLATLITQWRANQENTKEDHEKAA